MNQALRISIISGCVAHLYCKFACSIKRRISLKFILKNVIITPVIFFASSCTQQKRTLDFTNKDINNVLTKMTELMVHDVTNPPLAARFFSYTCLSGYEVIAENDSSMKSMHGILNDYPQIKIPAAKTNSDYHLAALLAMMETAKKMQPSGSLFNEYENNFIDSCKRAGLAADVIDSSKSYALEISKQILAYAKADKYVQTTEYPRYTPLKGDGYWYPTPPGFFAAVEPYFNTVRPFTLDSAEQFKPLPPAAFSTDKHSEFYALANAVYKEGLSSTKEHQLIASFWDCNPFAMDDNGHLMVGLKKISPGAHWLGITGIACAKTNTGFNKSMQIFTTVSVSLMDAFMCCWDEKYRSNRIRPETAIRKYIDPNWQPLLQTPPFPEYLSGHSVVSSASAVILTHYFGDHFSYTDSVEFSYGIQPRSFQSFQQAAQEAAISRFYGGIHFMDAINNGLTQGAAVGEWVLRKMSGNVKSNDLSAAKQ